MALPPLRDILNGQAVDATNPEYNFNALETFLRNEVIQRDGSVAMTAQLTLVGTPTQPNHAASKAYVDAIFPVGSSIEYFGRTLDPEMVGVWALCDGSEFSSTDPIYARLYQKLGPPGDDVLVDAGGGNYLLPDFRKKVSVGFDPLDPEFDLGAEGGDERGLPEHSHSFDHTHDVPHVHTQSPHSHSMAHTHSINHDHGAVNTVEGGAHSHGQADGVAMWRYGLSGSGYGTIDAHDGGAVAAAALDTWGDHDGHVHSVNLPNFTGTSGGSSAANTGTNNGTLGETGNASPTSSSPNVTETDAVGDPTGNTNYPPFLVVTRIIKL